MPMIRVAALLIAAASAAVAAPAPGERADALAQDQGVAGLCDASDPGCAEGLSLRQLRAKARSQVLLTGSSLGRDDLINTPGKVLFVQGTGLLLGPRMFVQRLAAAAGADTDGEEPYSIDCKRVDSLPQLTLALGGAESLVVQGAEYTSRRTDGQCLLTAMTLDDQNSAGVEWVLGDFGRPSAPALAQERWSMHSAMSALGGCSTCEQAAASAGTESVDAMCKSTCHSYGVPFGCSHICTKLEAKICGVNSDDATATPNCGKALCGYFMPSCAHSGSGSESGSSGSAGSADEGDYGGSSTGALGSIFGLSLGQQRAAERAHVSLAGASLGG
eukprot:CAMPEP_0115219670 /NCGR_PEP_ID=MMETSP0270-20121206/27044_1 /TAXON_ID=71861 /ORGANISM="Scrippsiella trochoidea, Strain CCMP3099" /LENGTH=330 /DNA_ID=CAMNT_0002633687 /DNA_START=56 /DNA_END=1045 /DNA_ORIENTATION=-